MPSSKKIAQQANMLGSLFKRLPRFLLRIFVSFIGIIFMLIALYLFTGVLILLVTPKSVPVDLANGFIYAEHPSPYHDSRMLTDQNGNVLVHKSVRRVLLSGKTVYGSREDPNYKSRMDSASGIEKIALIKSRGYVYYICTFGEDCSNTQNYSKDELQEILRQRNLLPFTPGEITNTRLAWAGIKRFFGFGVPEDFIVNVDTIRN